MGQFHKSFRWSWITKLSSKIYSNQLPFVWSADKSNQFKFHDLQSFFFKWKIMEQLKAFELIQKHFAYAGITPNLARQTSPFNAAILFGFLLLGLDIVSLLLFIAYDAELFDEYTQSVNTVSVLTLIFLALLVLIVKIEQLFELIDGGNDLVNISEFD